MFVVRAENAHGLSVPSGVSKVVHTLGRGDNSRVVPPQILDEARARLGTKVIILQELIPITSTAVKLSWEVRIVNNNYYKACLFIHFLFIFLLNCKQMFMA